MTPEQVRSKDLFRRHQAAIEAAREAGHALLGIARGGGLDVRSKGLQDFVTQADLEAETIIRNRLLGEFPSDGFLGEETGRLDAESGGRWVVDPIDGTTNFIKALPHWSVSIAFVDNSGPLIGVIFDPVAELLYDAIRGGGARCNGASISISAASDPGQSIGILGVSRRTPLDDHLKQIEDLYRIGMDYRRYGSAATGLASVADGRVEAFFEKHLNSWDALAGMVIAREAGAAVLAPPVEQFVAEGGAVIAGVPAIVELLPMLADNPGLISWNNGTASS